MNPVPAAHRRAADRDAPKASASPRSRRVGKRIVFELEGRALPGPPPDDRRAPALGAAGQEAAATRSRCSSSRRGTLALTEAGTQAARVAALVARPRSRALDPGGLEVLDSDAATTFAARAAAREPHAQARPHRSAPLQRHRQRLLRRDPAPRAALAARADAQARRRGDRAPARGDARRRCAEWTERLRARGGGRLPGEGHRVPRGHGRARPLSASRARSAARRCSASSTPRTRPTTARAARPAASSSPTARCRGC